MKGVMGKGGADKISRTANHLSTLQPVTDEQSFSTEEAARAERIDWQLKGAMGGQLSVIGPLRSLGHTCGGLDDPFNGCGCVFWQGGGSACKRTVDPKFRSPG